MKKLILPLLIIICASTIYVGCKKGPDDPFFTIKSRKGRVVGTWKVSSFAINGKEYAFSDTSANNIPAGACGTLSMSIHTGQNITFEFKETAEFTTSQQDTTITTSTYTVPSATCVNGPVTDISANTITSGTWTFAGGVGDYKNKEQLVLTSKDATTGEAVNDIYDIVRLSSKEIDLTYSYTNPSTSAVTKIDIVMKAVK